MQPTHPGLEKRSSTREFFELNNLPMKHTFYEIPEVVRAELEEDGIIHVRWQHLDDEIAKECAKAQMEQIKLGARHIILDFSNAKGILAKETQEWFVKEIYPLSDALGLKSVFVVKSQSLLTNISSKKLKLISTPFKFHMYETDSLEYAMERCTELEEV